MGLHSREPNPRCRFVQCIGFCTSIPAWITEMKDLKLVLSPDEPSSIGWKKWELTCRVRLRPWVRRNRKSHWRALQRWFLLQNAWLRPLSHYMSHWGMSPRRPRSSLSTCSRDRRVCSTTLCRWSSHVWGRSQCPACQSPSPLPHSLDLPEPARLHLAGSKSPVYVLLFSGAICQARQRQLADALGGALPAGRREYNNNFRRRLIKNLTGTAEQKIATWWSWQESF